MLRGPRHCVSSRRELLQCFQDRGPGIDSYDQVPGWLKEMGSVWEEVGAKDVFVPVGPWEKGGKLELVATVYTSLTLHVSLQTGRKDLSGR